MLGIREFLNVISELTFCFIYKYISKGYFINMYMYMYYQWVQHIYCIQSSSFSSGPYPIHLFFAFLQIRTLFSVSSFFPEFFYSFLYYSFVYFPHFLFSPMGVHWLYPERNPCTTSKKANHLKFNSPLSFHNTPLDRML